MCFFNSKLFHFISCPSLTRLPSFYSRLRGKHHEDTGGSCPWSSKGSIPTPKLLSLRDAPAAPAHEGHAAPQTLSQPSSKERSRVHLKEQFKKSTWDACRELGSSEVQQHFPAQGMHQPRARGTEPGLKPSPSPCLHQVPAKGTAEKRKEGEERLQREGGEEDRERAARTGGKDDMG